MESETTEKHITFFRFEDLRVYHKALDYAIWVHENTKSKSVCLHDNLCIKFNEAARSISLNISEGSARNKNQFIYYLKMAKSRVRECVVYTTEIKSLELIDDDQEMVSRNFLMEMTKMIGALITSLIRAGGGNKNYNDDNRGMPPQDDYKFDDNNY